ncbi:MAG: tetratricopeptide repeat-containing sulfotransferase family protein [Candidatus Pelagibacterales bacterium]
MNRKERRRLKKSSSHNQENNNSLLEAIKLHTQKNFKTAEDLYLKIIKNDKTNYQALRHLGILYNDTKRYKQAISYLTDAIHIAPSIPDAHNNLGLVYFVSDNLALAKKSFEKSFLLNNKYLPALNNLTRVYFSLNENEKCMQSAIAAIELGPDEYICKLNHALALSINGKINTGIKILEKLKEENKTDDLFNQLALMYEVSGNIKKSNQYLLESFKLNQHNYAMLVKLMDNNVITDKELNYNLEDIFKENQFDTLVEKSNLARCLYISYNRKKNYKLAGEYLVKSNKLRDQVLKYEIKKDEYFIGKIIENFDNKKITIQTQKLNKKITPIFIVGMPRSGTTLTEQILASHSEVHGGGELDYVRNSLEIDGVYNLSKKQTDQIIAKLMKLNNDEWDKIGNKYLDNLGKINLNNKKYITDKMPHNFMMCGIINKMLPHAKIIYCYRDPMDNCFSLYRNTFAKSGHGYSYDQDKLALHYNLHTELMNHWRSVLGEKILLLKNESLIDNQKEVTNKLLKHCELEWEDACLEFYKTERNVRTISLRQVRNPINKNSLGVWKKYSESLKKMNDSLREFQ